tara:strand:- start:28821 stop:29021 length:201 start_codon:yes stop_codon:yes gene_type:complete
MSKGSARRKENTKICRHSINALECYACRKDAIIEALTAENKQLREAGYRALNGDDAELKLIVGWNA